MAQSNEDSINNDLAWFLVFMVKIKSFIIRNARGFSPGTRPGLAAKRTHRIARMIFAAKAGRAPGGAAQFAYKPIAVFGFYQA